MLKHEFPSKIIVHRICSTNENAYMITEDIIGTIEPNSNYKIEKDNIIKIELTESEQNMHILKQPDYITLLEGEWILEAAENQNKERNILGNDGIFITNQKEIKLKKQIATENNLAFYGAKLYKIGDILGFENVTDTFPVTIVDVGKDYAKDYIMDPNLGGGVYLEYHNNPHFHMPLDDKCEGCLILGKKVNEKYALSAFQIPYGYAVYTPGWIIHNDCFLIGRYLVVYAISNEYSTVILKDNNDNLVKVDIE